MNFVRTNRHLFVGTAIALLSLSGYAQTTPPKTLEAPKALEAPSASFAERHPYGPTSIRVFTLKNVTQIQDGNEILTGLRNHSDPRDRMTYIASQNAIIIEAPADHLAEDEKLINALDQPRKLYRLTYTLIDLDGTKRLGDQHYNMVVVSGQRTVLKQGNKVPVITGMDYKNPSPQAMITYIDIGMDFDATLDGSVNALRLKTKVSQSSVVEERTAATSVQDPVLRQSVFEGTSLLTPGKPQTIGTLDITGSTRRIEIQVMAEPINF